MCEGGRDKPPPPLIVFADVLPDVNLDGIFVFAIAVVQVDAKVVIQVVQVFVGIDFYIVSAFVLVAIGLDVIVSEFSALALNPRIEIGRVL